MILSQRLVDDFRRLSWDRNDLHWNAGYARRTQFGEPIVYGMASLLAALGQWANGRHFRLKSIHGELKGPAFVGRELELDIKSDGDVVTAGVINGVDAVARFKWSAEVGTGCETWPGAAGFDFSRSRFYLEKAIPTTPVEMAMDDYEYALNATHIEGLASFALRPGQLPLAQLQFLLWTSYFVGMQYPGRQALYSSLKVDFAPDAGDERPSITLRRITGTLDSGFGVAQIRVTAPFLESATIAAFRRPDPVEYSLCAIEREIASRDLLKGLRVFVSGSSRGFGNALAKCAALMGARLDLHARSESDESRAALADVREASPESEIHYADLTQLDQTRTLARELVQSDPPHWVVLNAYPRIIPKNFVDQTTADFVDFLLRSVRMNAELLHELLPGLGRDAKVVLISSAYVQRAPTGFSHYVAAKNALEGLVAGVARERPDLQFYILRLPRMRTDQTVALFSRLRTHAPIPIAVQMIERVMSADRQSNLHILDYQSSPSPIIGAL
jgi:NAD(P)-dependent dehydrogenase (short-subunit alcohol dehydrogenase family)